MVYVMIYLQHLLYNAHFQHWIIFNPRLYEPTKPLRIKTYKNNYIHPRKLTAGYPKWWALEKAPPALNMANFGIYIKFLGGYIIHPPHPHLSLRIPRPPKKTVPILRFGPPTLWDLVEAHVAQILLAHAPLIGLPRDRNFRWIPAVGTLGLWLLLEMFFNERNLQETRTVVGPWDTKIPKKQTCWVFRSFFVGQKQERFQWKGLIHEILELWKLPSLETSGRNRRSPHKATKIMPRDKRHLLATSTKNLFCRCSSWQTNTIYPHATLCNSFFLTDWLGYTQAPSNNLTDLANYGPPKTNS